MGDDEKSETRPWSDLPQDIVNLIARRLRATELAVFLSVCKNWNSASASAEIECEPWFFVYDGDMRGCAIREDTGKLHIAKFPELEGSTCIASDRGWLLFYQGSSLFFFNPFSRAKVDLPELHLSDTKDLVGAFTAPPTSQDSVVSVAFVRDDKLNLYATRRGDDKWSQREHKFRNSLKTCKLGHYFEDMFHFLDAEDNLVTYSIKDDEISCYRIYRKKPVSTDVHPLHYDANRELSDKMFNTLELGDNIQVSVCGTVRRKDRRNVRDRVIYSETRNANPDSGALRCKGVWLYPRIYRLPSDQKW